MTDENQTYTLGAQLLHELVVERRRDHALHAAASPAGATPIANIDAMSLAAFGSVTFGAFRDDGYDRRADLAELRQRLLANGYDEPSVLQALGVPSLQELRPSQLRYLSRHRLGTSSRDVLIRLFLLGEAVALDRLVDILGGDAVELLIEMGACFCHGNACAACISLYPVGDRLFATDPRWHYLLWPSPVPPLDSVMYIGGDSISLLNTTPAARGSRVLDLCCGSGVQGVCAAAWADEVVCVDINPRAVRLARFNIQLNGIDHAVVRQGDLFSPVAGERFDVVLANPPFVPEIPSESLRFRDGGIDGEAVLARIVAGADEALRDGGRLLVVSDFFGIDEYAAKVARWWGDRTAAVGIVLAEPNMNVFDYAVGHVAPYQDIARHDAAIDEWVRALESVAPTISRGVIAIHKQVDGGRSDFEVLRIRNAMRPIQQDVARCFAVRETLRGPSGIASRTLALSPDIWLSIDVDCRTRSARFTVSSPDNPFFVTTGLSREAYDALTKLRTGGRSWAELELAHPTVGIERLARSGVLRLEHGGAGDERAGVVP